VSPDTTHSPAQVIPQLRDTILSPAFWLALLAVLIAACAVVNVGRLLALAALAAITLSAWLLTRTPLRRLNRLLPIISFALFCFLLLLIIPIDAETETIQLPLWGREVPHHGTWFILALLIKSTLIVLLTTAFAERLSQRDLLAGLTALHLPAKLVSLCYLMLRGLDSIAAELRRMMRARDARGAVGGMRAVKVAAAMAQVLIIRLARRAETQAFALCARGYAGRIPLSHYRSITLFEGIALIISLVALAWLTLL